uniref:topoisomerase C-terminal repeat-containing protein n=1 Tax=Hafnia alvei TaxID=569 RepID=UPI00242D7C7E|nr:topoisomerase C-terminal repeat-containing protein [Hafnia alvei]
MVNTDKKAPLWGFEISKIQRCDLFRCHNPLTSVINKIPYICITNLSHSVIIYNLRDTSLACGKALIVTPKSVSCSSCVFVVWSTLAGKRLTDNQLETIIVKGKSSELEGFTSKAGKPFSAFVILVDKTTGRLGFDFPPRKGQ